MRKSTFNLITLLSVASMTICFASPSLAEENTAQSGTNASKTEAKTEAKTETKSEKSQTSKMPTVTINDQEIKLEIAQTEQEIQRGLMMRTSLATDSGMVFLFNPPRPVNFWMYNTLIHLDMIFIRDGKIVKIFENVPPGPSKDYRKCPTYPAGDGILVNQVVEVEGGYCQKKGIKEGNTVQFSLK